jgi:GldM C-terminal domain
MIAIKKYYFLLCLLFLSLENGNAQNLMLSIPKNNSIYRGVDYEIELGFLSENNQDFDVSLSKKGSIIKINSNRYIINSCEVGLLNVQVKYKDSVFVKPIIIENFNLVPSVLGRQGGAIALEEFTKANEIFVYLDVSNLKVNCKISYFEFGLTRKGANNEIVTVKNEGALFSEQIRSYLKTLMRGDWMMFKQIKAKCQCDDNDFPIGSVSFIVR